jgi:hypothetical protein
LYKLKNGNDASSIANPADLKDEVYAFFATQFKKENEDYLRKYVYDSNDKLFDPILKVLESRKNPDPGNDETIKTQVYNLFTKKTTIKETIQILEMKRTGLINGNSRSRSSDKEAEANIQLLNQVIEKLKRIKKDDSVTAVNLFISVKEIAENSKYNYRLFNNNDVDERVYDDVLKGFIAASIKIKAATMMSDFVNNGKQIKLGSPNPKDPSKKIMSRLEEDLTNELRAEFGDQLFTNNELINSVANVYEPERRTSNMVLYSILYKIKMGKFPKDAEKNADIKTKLDATISDTGLFKKIYDYYLAKYPDRSEFGKIEHALYTGVDQIRTIGEKDNSGIKRTAYEIYVRLDLVDADELAKTPRGVCKLNDRIVTNNYGELTDDSYFDGATLSKAAYRALNIDDSLSDAITKLSETPSETKNDPARKSSDKPQVNQNFDNNESDDFTGGFSQKHKRYTRVFRRNRTKQKTLRKK